jgi:hypothetical protein
MLKKQANPANAFCSCRSRVKYTKLPTKIVDKFFHKLKYYFFCREENGKVGKFNPKHTGNRIKSPKKIWS